MIGRPTFSFFFCFNGLDRPYMNANKINARAQAHGQPNYRAQIKSKTRLPPKTSARKNVGSSVLMIGRPTCSFSFCFNGRDRPYMNANKIYARAEAHGRPKYRAHIHSKMRLTRKTKRTEEQRFICLNDRATDLFVLFLFQWARSSLYDH